MTTLAGNLLLPRCPHCSIANPNLSKLHALHTTDHTGGNQRAWVFYKCGTCGGVVTAAGAHEGRSASLIFPVATIVHEDVPERVREYLQQAIDSVHAPAGAVMLAASAVDAMLKLKEYTKGSLYSRIDQAVSDNLLTEGMGAWAHNVRLDANDQRHSDEEASLPTPEDGERSVEFAQALAEFLFVLPAKVQRGIKKPAGSDENESG